MDNQVHFIDTTFRDGSQSLWALGLRSGMIEAVAERTGRAGFHAVEVPVTGIYFKKFVRDLKENPWDVARVVAKQMPHTLKCCMATGAFHPFEPPPPRSVVELFFARIAQIGALNRAQMTSNTRDQIKRNFPADFRMFRNLGIQVVTGLSYTVSPRHTDAYYAQKTRELAALAPDAIYLKDQGGLVTVDRLRTLLPAILANANGIPVEVHSHCTAGLADLVYMEALALGVRRLHTGIPPLASGSAQPSVFNVARNARLLGYQTALDEGLLQEVSASLTAIARREGLPLGAPLQYDCGQYIHQVPGGVIANLKHQLGQMGMLHRLAEVIEESVQVRRELGYPIMITPHSQFMVTQSAINVATGERYRHVIDELILFAQGEYGEDSGYPWMDPNLKDRLLGSPRARELEERAARRRSEIPLAEIRAMFGGAGISDEEFLLRYIMKGSREVEAMHAAGPPRQYCGAGLPLARLIRELQRHSRVRYVQVRRGGDSLTLSAG